MSGKPLRFWVHLVCCLPFQLVLAKIPNFQNFLKTDKIMKTEKLAIKRFLAVSHIRVN